MKKKIRLTFNIIVTAFILVFIFLTYPSFYKSNINIEVTKINSKYINNNDIKIAVISDVNLFYDFQIENLRTAVDLLNLQNPDVVIFNGNLIAPLQDEALKDNYQLIIDELSRIQAKQGQFAILSDQDIAYKDISDIFFNSGFEVLSNENRRLIINQEIIYINAFKDISIVRKLKNDIFNITFITNPGLIPNIADDKIDLIITSGTRAGEYNLPFIGSIYSEIRNTPYYKTKSHINGRYIHSSNGLGTLKSNMRLLSRPSIDVFIISPEVIE